MILRQHDGDLTERERLDRAIETAKREMNDAIRRYHWLLRVKINGE